MGGTSTWSAIDTLSNPGKERVRTECRPGDTECPAYQQGLANQRRTNVLLGVTAGFGVVTVLIGALATDWSGGGAADPPSLDRVEPIAGRLKGSVASVRIVPWVEVGNGLLAGAEGRF